VTILYFKTLIFFLFSILYFFSSVGFGKILVKNSSFQKLTFNFFELFIYGLIVQIVFGFLFYISFGTNEFINLLILILGLFLYYFYKKDLNKINFKYIFALLVSIFSVVLISKTGEDFVGYHLFSINEIFENQLRFGVNNLNDRFFHSSLLIYNQSLLVLPILKFQLIHLPKFFIYYSVLGYFIHICLTTGKDNERFFSLFVCMLLLIKFNRLSAFGYDYISQFLLIIVFHKIYFYQTNREELIKAFKIFTFTILIKPISLLFSPILIYLLYKNKIQFLLNIFYTKILFFILLIFILFSSSFLRTGCIFYPINKTCFSEEKIFWSEKKLVKETSEFVKLWAKNYYYLGTSKYEKIHDKHVFKQNFNWFKYWIEGHFFYKISEFLLILISIILIIHIYHTREKPSFKKSSYENHLIFILSAISIFFWILTVPQFRFGFASIVVFIYLLFNYFMKLEIFLDKKKFLILIMFSLMILNIKNFNRIKKEFERDDIYKFINFPFYNQFKIYNKAHADINENVFTKDSFFHIEIIK
jgi:hypothetical protein